MSSNKYRAHVLVIPEDEADRELAVGFLLHDNIQQRVVTILPPAGGWIKTVDKFVEELQPTMADYEERRIVLLIDFDSDLSRLERVNQRIQESCRERVFVLGVFSAPEKMRQSARISLEDIGLMLATECYEEDWRLWTHELLSHNAAELKRLAISVKPFVFK